MGFWYKDLLAINGFNNEYEGWGREDSDLAWRLVHSGVKRRKIKFAAIALHLYHKELPRTKLSSNDKLLKRMFENKNSYRCLSGIKEENIKS